MPSYMLVFAWFLSLPSLHCEMSKAHRTTKSCIRAAVYHQQAGLKIAAMLAMFALVGDAVFTSRTT